MTARTMAASVLVAGVGMPSLALEPGERVPLVAAPAP